MSRWPRQWRAGTVQHLVSRFVDRRFIIDDNDRRIYLTLLTKYWRSWDWSIISYALMSSHLHMGSLAGEIPPVKLFLPLHTRFSQLWHQRHGGLGPIFADRPANWEVMPDLIGRMIAYHHKNPVRAGVVQSPDQTLWTSHRAYLRLEKQPVWLDVERGLALAGFDDTEKGRKAFDEFVREVDLEDFDWPHMMCEDHPAMVLRASNLSEEEWSALAEIAARLANVPSVRIPGKYRNPKIVRARRLFAAAAHRCLGQASSAVAARLGLCTSAVYNLLSRNPVLVEQIRPYIGQLLEQWREQTGFDGFVGEL